MSGSGSSVTDEVKVSAKVRRNRKNDIDNKSPVVGDTNSSAFELITDEIKIEQEMDPLAVSEIMQHNGNEDDDTPVCVKDQVGRIDTTSTPQVDAPDIEDVDETTQDAEVFGFDKDSDVEEGPIEEEEEEDEESSCFKIDKVYSVADKDDENKQKVTDAEISRVAKKSEAKVEGKPSKNEESKKNVKEEKLLKPKTTMTTLAKVPTLTTTGVAGVRLLGGGLRGTNMPLLVSMGAGSPGIPLLPAGLPPGRYVILPGTSTTTKTTCATVNTTSASMAPRLATGVSPVVAAVGQATSVASTITAAAAVSAARSLTPTIQIPPRSHTRERGRRKSYTTGEKLAMIEAVEAGQRKSTVADRFGVAPSTLACILAQKNKIRAEQDNLTRRRFRHVKYNMGDDGRGAGTSSRVLTTSATPTLQCLAPSQDQPFTHFLASLTGSTPTVFDTQPEEIIAVPDLMERIEGGTGGGGAEGGGGGVSRVSEGKGEGDGEDDDGGSGVECLGVIEASGSSMDIEYQPDHSHDKPPVFSHHHSLPRVQQTDAIEETGSQEISDRPVSPTNQGLTGPYLLKKETHCATVLDQLLRDDTYTDVTLTAEGQSLRAHRIVLSLSSPYFRQVLSREQNVQSVVLLRDIKFAELRNIIHFIYTGEATVDASDLESFMRTAEMLEISSLSEGQKYISSRGLSQGGAATGFSIADFERLVGAKRPSKEPSSPPSKARRISGEGPSSRSSSTEPTASSIPLALIKEEPSGDPPSTSQEDKSGNEKPTVVDQLNSSEPTKGETTKPDREVSGCKRKRRDSSGSIGGFAAIAGVQKASSEAEDDEDIFPQTDKSETRQSEDNDRSIDCEANSTSLPGRCPYCPHVSQKFEGVAMMRHLLVSHPCKPAFPCSFCWRVFVKRSNFKSHLQNCQQSY